MRSAIVPPPSLRPADWTQEHFYLSREYSRPGKLTLWPFQVEPLNCLDPMHPCREIVIMCASQVLKTTIIQAAIAFWISTDPGPALAWFPREKDASKFVLKRMDPMARDIAPLRERIAEKKSRDSGNTIERKAFPGGQIEFQSAQSPQNFAGDSARYGFIDDFDRCEEYIGDEGNIAQLIRNRFTNFVYNSKFIWSSSPTILGRSNIGKRWKESDQRSYHVPCPKCGAMQVLRWEQMRWRPEDVRKCWYLCQHCDAAISESAKWDMIHAGKWIAENPASEIPGFTIGQQYSPQFPWYVLIQNYLEAKGDAESEKTFFNTRLGLPVEQAGEAPNWEIIKGKAEDYPLGTVPDGVAVLTAGADVQKDRIEIAVRGWGPRNENWLVDYIILRGKTASPEVWQQLSEVMQSPYRHPRGADLFINLLALDTGYNTQECYDWIRTQPADRVIGIKGVNAASGIFGRPSSVDRRHNGKEMRRGLKVWPLNVNILKGELYGALLNTQVPGLIVPKNLVHIPKGMSDEWYQQLVAEEVVIRRDRYNREEFVWAKKGPNEVLDTFIYARGAHDRLGCDRWSEERWAEVRRALRVDQVAFDFSMPVSPSTSATEQKPQEQLQQVREILPPAAKAVEAPPPSFSRVVVTEAEWF